MGNAHNDAGLLEGAPVQGFGTFKWMSGDWADIFDRQVDVIKSDLARAQAEDRLVVYLSCPISSRGGGSSRINVEIAHFTARRLLRVFGEQLFVLNPAAYQLESREGTGLILTHIAALFPRKDPKKELARLRGTYVPGGGDYMRMWTRALVEDEYLRDPPGTRHPKRGLNCGGLFDAYYFIGPGDMAEFFGATDRPRIEPIEALFSRKRAIDYEFRLAFDFTDQTPPQPLDIADPLGAAVWETRREAFLRYYSLRAGASFSLGSRDEWNILVRVNRRRRSSVAYGPGEELACFFDGCQVNPVSSEQMLLPGYEIIPATPGDEPDHPGEISFPR